MDSVSVWIPPALRERTGNRRQVEAQGRTVREMIDTLEGTYPGLRFHLCHETGELRPFVNIFLEGENVRYLQGLDTPLMGGATVHIIHSVAGG
ncbi:MAG: MoaD/ThiS family protein [Chloroflexi bacterium]|nr:MoaD/ThiS family protein [Chloroflexota bacterium]